MINSLLILALFLSERSLTFAKPRISKTYEKFSSCALRLGLESILVMFARQAWSAGLWTEPVSFLEGLGWDWPVCPRSDCLQVFRGVDRVSKKAKQLVCDSGSHSPPRVERGLLGCVVSVWWNAAVVMPHCCWFGSFSAVSAVSGQEHSEKTWWKLLELNSSWVSNWTGVMKSQAFPPRPVLDNVSSLCLVDIHSLLIQYLVTFSVIRVTTVTLQWAPTCKASDAIYSTLYSYAYRICHCYVINVLMCVIYEWVFIQSNSIHSCRHHRGLGMGMYPLQTRNHCTKQTFPWYQESR